MVSGKKLELFVCLCYKNATNYENKNNGSKLMLTAFPIVSLCKFKNQISAPGNISSRSNFVFLINDRNMSVFFLYE